MNANPSFPRCLFAVAAFILGLAASLGPASAQSPFTHSKDKTVDAMKDFRDAETQVDTAWDALSLQMGRIMFVTEKAPVYGAYTQRANAVFKPGETLLTYIEPVGYSYQPGEDGYVTFGVTLDFEIVLPDGTVVGGKKGFLTYSAKSRARMKELMLNASLDISDAPEGDYALHWTLHDINNGKIAEAKLPFTIAK